MKLDCHPREVLEYLVRVNNGQEMMRGNMDICDTETCRPIHTTITLLYNSTWCWHCFYMICTDLRTNSNFCLIQH